MTDFALPIPYPLPPMEARTADALPASDTSQRAAVLYEPKWDGFRCLVYRDGDAVELQSKSEKSMTRYFPEMVEAVRLLRPTRFVLDGELAVASDGGLAFDALLQRIHPAESRVRKLARETPAVLLIFDLLATGEKTSLLDRPLEERRERLEEWAHRYLESGASAEGTGRRGASREAEGASRVYLSPATRSRDVAERWLRELSSVDGVMVKDLEQPYLAGKRDGMIKVKRYRSADCVVGGFRYASSGRGLGSLLLGLYDEDGLLHHVGFTSSFSGSEGDALLGIVEPLVGPPGFTGNAPGGPSRWSRGERTKWQPVRPELVVEVRYDHVTGSRFRHGTKLLRPRPDKAPRQCTLDQLERSSEDALDLLEQSRLR